MKTNGTARLVHPRDATPGTTDPETGEFTPAPASDAPYATERGFLLDVGSALAFNEAGTPTETSDAQLFLPRGSVARDGIVLQDTVTFTYDLDGTTVDASVLRAVRALDVLQLRRL